jgi:uncharacterized membrane protein
MSSPTSPNVGRRGLVAVAAVAALTPFAIGAMAASADPPPAAAGNTSHGFLVDRGSVTSIDHPKATTVPATADAQAGTVTTGINDHGQVVGAYEGRDRVVRHFLRDRKGRYTKLEDPPGGSDFDEYVDINNRGDIVGFYNDDQGVTTTAFLRTRKGRFVDIRVPGAQLTGVLKINERRQVVGLYIAAGAEPGAIHGFVWDDGRYTTVDVPGAAGTAVLGINNRGEMVGSYIDREGRYHGFRRDRRGAVTTLPEAPGADPTMGGTQPVAINDRGRIVGLAYDAQGGSRGFQLRRGELTPIDAAPDAVFTRPLDINNQGHIVGDYGTRPNSRSSWCMVPGVTITAGTASLHRWRTPSACSSTTAAVTARASDRRLRAACSRTPTTLPRWSSSSISPRRTSPATRSAPRSSCAPRPGARTPFVA